ncbi:MULTISPECIES: FecCD family ABC transporter permease [Campylobacter]|uniref:Iron ABC transporter permease n=1 Tax=Campylobacter porcelli TaxID=1660073 RepID=A0ABU7M3J0_9BACT|nr:iron ABC transporter permease [Campylobacter sp. P0024]MCR8678760.1 iron ABC transporter permease [Campylobacter sp. RM19072]MEE3744218.1 iron ABC transporter permease [Campylobacter sp. CX2-4855-23]MEE3777359.1 iron ABC transporter permease [Campylobacter sp. CX2-4080-23]
MQKAWRTNLFFIALCIFLVIYSLSVGGADISFGDILKLFSDPNSIDEAKKTILLEIRLPRLIMALLIGMLLASSGVIVQSVFLNPLADPYIIGIAASATFGAVIAYFLKLPDIYYGVFAFFVASALSLVIFSLYKKGKSIATLLIIGIAFSSFLGAFTSFATYLIGEDSFKIVAWMMGFLSGATWEKVAILIVPVIFSTMYFYFKRHELNVLLSGDDEAKTLGVNVQKSKKILLIIASLATAFSVAFTGMIGFVGLIIPHTLRLILKTSSNATLIPASLIVGALFLLFCDNLSKSILSPIEIPIGVVTAFFGAPFFLFLAIKQGKASG